ESRERDTVVGESRPDRAQDAMRQVRAVQQVPGDRKRPLVTILDFPAPRARGVNVVALRRLVINAHHLVGASRTDVRGDATRRRCYEPSCEHARLDPRILLY